MIPKVERTFSDFPRHLICLALTIVIIHLSVTAQSQQAANATFTRADTLRGMLTPIRSCYDVKFYELELKVDVKRRFINGSNGIYYEAVQNFDSIQIDLTQKLKIEKITYLGDELIYRRDLNAVIVKFPKTQLKGSKGMLKCYYSGAPVIARSPPWDGGFVWKKDANNNDWVGVACEGAGASTWWPCKDHLSDEPDSMAISFIVPADLVCVSNGNLRGVEKYEDGTTKWNWFVSYPINNYNVTLNLADYSHFEDLYLEDRDTLKLDYYVLAANVGQAKTHFSQVKPMLACFEEYFGPYPFMDDGFALVETNYWGMEHQGAIAYGNNYENNKNGFDYIIIHESAHEWWGNNISCADMADLWIHESFATYAEALYVECMQGKQAAIDYLVSQKWQITDAYPIIGPYNVNYQGAKQDNDLYYKGSWMLHTFRNVLANDTLFFKIIKGIQEHFRHSTVTTDLIVGYINEHAGMDFTPFFDQYLRHATPPVLEYRIEKKGTDAKLEYRWNVAVNNFTMPVEVTSSYDYSFGKQNKTYVRISPTKEWQTILLPGLKPENFDVNTDMYYVKKKLIR